jgi:hypothetical protein
MLTGCRKREASPTTRPSPGGFSGSQTSWKRRASGSGPGWRQQLEHLILAAAVIVDDDTIVVIGSQALRVPNALK